MTFIQTMIVRCKFVDYSVKKQDLWNLFFAFIFTAEYNHSSFPCL